jgi:hypothetical protein
MDGKRIEVISGLFLIVARRFGFLRGTSLGGERE